MNTHRMTYLGVAVLVIATTVLSACVPVTAPAPAQPPAPVQAPAQATVPPVAATNPPAPAGIQSLPNMGQQISPLAPQGSSFESLNPDLADNPDWLAGQAVTTVVSPDKKTMLVLTSGYNRVFRTDGVPDAFGSHFNWPDSQEYVFIYDISTKTPVKKTGAHGS